MSGFMPGIEAIVQRYRPVPGGYLMAVRIASRVEITDWYAELVAPDGAAVQAGRGTTVTKQPISYRAEPADGHLYPSGGSVATGAVYIAVGAQPNAPRRLRVKANGVNTGGWVEVKGVYTTDSRGRLVPATEAAWPGSTAINTDLGGWEHGSGGGFGGGGGGGGGGQSELIAEIDETGKLRRLEHKTDGGGGGGAGGGGGWGSGAQEWAAAGEQQGQQQGGHQDGNPLTKLQATVDSLVKRVEAIERKVR